MNLDQASKYLGVTNKAILWHINRLHKDLFANEIDINIDEKLLNEIKESIKFVYKNIGNKTDYKNGLNIETITFK